MADERQHDPQGTGRRSEDERNALVLEANRDGVFDANLITGENYYSPEWLAQIGYLPGELPGIPATWQERLHPDDREQVETALREYLSRRTPTFGLDYRIRHRDGHWCWLHVRAKGVWDEQGMPVRLVGSHSDITDRKRAEDELKASETRLRTFLDNNPAITFIKDEDGRMVYTNASMRKLFGIGDDGWLGKTGSEIWPLDVAARLHASDVAVLTSESSTEVLEEVPMRDGTTRQFLATKFAFTDASGAKAMGGIALDVTDQRRSEAELRHSESRYRELFERNPLPGWIYRTDNFKFVDINQAALEHYGWTREEILNLTVHGIRIADEFDDLEAQFAGRLDTKGERRYWHHRRKDGSVIWVDLMALDLNSSEAPLRLVLANDVTAQIEAKLEARAANDHLERLVKERTKELLESKLRFQVLVEASPQMIWAMGPAGEVEFASARVLEYMGRSLDDLKRDRWLQALHPDDIARVAQVWQRSVASGEPYHDEYRLRSKEGEYRWFKALGQPVRDSDGRILRWVGTSTDIHDRKQSEESLEAAVASRTAELAEARDRAELATQAKSSFLAAMSHEIRTPMNGVIGMANLMLDTQLTSQQRCYMETIRSSGDALLAVINDILDLSKIEAGRLQLEREPFDLSTLVEESFEVISTQASAKSLKLLCKVDENVPLDLMGDAARLRQVILNLLSNAVKFTAEGSVSLSVSQEAKRDQLTVLRFAVRDTGIGLSQSQQEHLFQAFQQADQSTSRRFGGTGLGLAISKRLVETMGGAIGVHSVPGEGSTFFFNVCLETALTLSGAECFQGKQVALICGNDEEALKLLSHLSGAGLTVTRYAKAPQSGRLAADVIVVDSNTLGKRSVAAQFFTLTEGPIAILGTPSDFHFPLPVGKRPPTFVEKPVRRLPLLRTIQTLLEGDAPAEKAPTGDAPPKVERAHVLLAEDNKVNQMVARILLERMGCRVDIVENGVAACRAVQYGSYDLVLMDCQMPTMSGFEATERIRNFEKSRRRTPIIALTAGVLQEERERCYASGMDDFVAKPISAKELEKALDRWIAAPAETPEIKGQAD